MYISEVETCIFFKVGTAFKDLESMKMSDMDIMFNNKYVPIVRLIPDDCFVGNSVCLSMLEKFMGAKKPNTGWSLLHMYKKNVGDIYKFGLCIPGIKSLSELPSGTTQLSYIRNAKQDDDYGASNIVLPCPSS
jgi:hypothetical protein